MKIFSKIFHNKSMVTIIALAVCLAILFFAYRYRVNTAINAINVPIAKETLTARTEITKDMIRTVKVAQSMITENVVLNEDYLVGKFVNYNTFIPEGGLFYTNAVVEWSQMPDSAWSTLEEGYTITSLAVDSQTTYGNSIFPGDKIDLYYQNSMDGKMFLGPIVKAIEVLAVKDENGSHIFKKGSEQQQAQALIFAVPDETFSFLERASYITGGDIIPIPRNANYNAETALEENEIINFINTNSLEVKPSKTDNKKIEENPNLVD